MSSRMLLTMVSKLLLSTLSSSILTSRSILMLILVVMVVIIDPFNSLAANAARLRLEGKATRDSLITRDEVSTAKETC